MSFCKLFSVMWVKKLLLLLLLLLLLHPYTWLNLPLNNNDNKDPKEQTSIPLILTRGSYVVIKWELKDEMHFTYITWTKFPPRK